MARILQLQPVQLQPVWQARCRRCYLVRQGCQQRLPRLCACRSGTAVGCPREGPQLVKLGRRCCLYHCAHCVCRSSTTVGCPGTPQQAKLVRSCRSLHSRTAAEPSAHQDQGGWFSSWTGARGPILHPAQGRPRPTLHPVQRCRRPTPLAGVPACGQHPYAAPPAGYPGAPGAPQGTGTMPAVFTDQHACSVR